MNIVDIYEWLKSNPQKAAMLYASIHSEDIVKVAQAIEGTNSSTVEGAVGIILSNPTNINCVKVAKGNLTDIIYRQIRLLGIPIAPAGVYKICSGWCYDGIWLKDANMIYSLKKAWEYILYTLSSPITWDYIKEVNGIVTGKGRGYCSRLRTNTITVYGNSIPPTHRILEVKDDPLKLYTYILQTMPFEESNENTAMLIANKWLMQD